MDPSRMWWYASWILHLNIRIECYYCLAHFNRSNKPHEYGLCYVSKTNLESLLSKYASNPFVTETVIYDHPRKERKKSAIVFPLFRFIPADFVFLCWVYLTLLFRSFTRSLLFAGLGRTASLIIDPSTARKVVSDLSKDVEESGATRVLCLVLCWLVLPGPEGAEPLLMVRKFFVATHLKLLVKQGKLLRIK